MNSVDWRQQAHTAIDSLFDAAEKTDAGPAAVERWSRCLIALLTPATAAARQRLYGRASLEVPVTAGAPDGHKPSSAGFIASVK
ncbi:hypothetical protein [Lacipirellula sp.]|uniref:hypothetical protein n=1 Tax=Lacipirellula sp. TaxID=2691419 RepID=UPI003D0E20C9